jgi:hypothetical protein
MERGPLPSNNPMPGESGKLQGLQAADPLHFSKQGISTKGVHLFALTNPCALNASGDAQWHSGWIMMDYDGLS